MQSEEMRALMKLFTLSLVLSLWVIAPSTALAQTFDAALVDQILYPHQKVGRPYKIMGKSFSPKHEPSYDVTGDASIYGPKYHGKPTSSGELFDKDALTAAHTTLPLNSLLYVSNPQNGKSVLVKLNDRGPFTGKQIIDLSEGTARALGLYASEGGTVRVRYAGPAELSVPAVRDLNIASPEP